ncbi:MAG TPA: phenol degradation protein meta, partial [Pseudolabrys sp.]
MKPIAFLAALAISAPQNASADEGGVSFWVPGFFGSLAATPQQPGWTNAFIFYHTSVSAGGDVAFARQVNRGNLNVNFSGNLNANIDADANLGMWAPSYVFKDPFLGGQAALALLVPFG